MSVLFPSWLSLFFTTFTAGSILAITTWSSLTRSPLLYDYFFGPQGAVLILQSTPGAWKAMWNAFMTMPLAHNLIVLIASAAIGLIVYAVLQSFNRTVAGGAMAWLDIHTNRNKSEKRYIEYQFGIRLVTRIVLAGVWLWYALVTLRVIIPFCALTAENGSQQLPALQGVLYTLLAFSTLVLALHLHVMLLRIWVRRRRVFGVSK